MDYFINRPEIGNLSSGESAILDLVFKKGKLRKSKPNTKKTKMIVENPEYPGSRYICTSWNEGIAAYVWRMVCFEVIPFAPYSCIPIMADMDLPYNSWDDKEWKEGVMEYAKRLTDKVRKAIPLQEQRGTNRWANAILGTNLPTF